MNFYLKYAGKEYESVWGDCKHSAVDSNGLKIFTYKRFVQFIYLLKNKIISARNFIKKQNYKNIYLRDVSKSHSCLSGKHECDICKNINVYS